MNNNENLLEVTKLRKYFPIKGVKGPGVQAVQDVSFAIKKGETLGLVGESGCGKTTLGRTVLRLYEPTGGKIVYDGKVLFDNPLNPDGTPVGKAQSVNMLPYRRKMQIIFQDPFSSLDPRMTVSQLIAEPLKYHPILKTKSGKALEKETEETEAENAQAKQSPEEMRQKELKEVIEQYNREKQDPDYYYLPDQWDGQKLIWQKSGDQTGSLLASLAFFAAFVVMLKKAKEQQEEMAKRAEQLLMDYPSLIMKFTLLIQAGMTVRRAFQKISSDYLRNCPKEGRYAYEAVTTTCHEMDSGVAELEAYRRFGERCGQMKYKTFSTILIQNLQKGGHRMADLLEKEALEAWDERKRKARVMGETAATKLLVPMIMMLAVVMAIIMIPAFLSFYG